MSKSQKCKCITLKGTRCSRKATDNGYCYQHKDKCKKSVEQKIKKTKIEKKIKNKKIKSTEKMTDNKKILAENIAKVFHKRFGNVGFSDVKRGSWFDKSLKTRAKIESDAVEIGFYVSNRKIDGKLKKKYFMFIGDTEDDFNLEMSKKEFTNYLYKILKIVPEDSAIHVDLNHPEIEEFEFENTEQLENFIKAENK